MHQILINFQTDIFGAQAGIDAKPKVGFGDAVRESSNSEERRRKRQTEADNMNGEKQPQDPDAREMQGLFQEMWQTMLEGGKKIIKKVAEMVDRDGSQRPEGQ